MNTRDLKNILDGIVETPSRNTLKLFRRRGWIPDDATLGKPTEIKFIDVVKIWVGSLTGSCGFTVEQTDHVIKWIDANLDGYRQLMNDGVSVMRTQLYVYLFPVLDDIVDEIYIRDSIDDRLTPINFDDPLRFSLCIVLPFGHGLHKLRDNVHDGDFQK